MKGTSMESQIDGAMHGDSYRRYNVCRLVLRLNFMETRIEVTMNGDS